MPEDSKKPQEKKKHDPKEQRKPRNSRNQASKVERKVEKVEESKSAPKVPQKPPVYEDPGPEFYKNLKRETEEILKITEEENSKYKKKEIQSNWSKYEMPIESYEEVEEHDVGADYEKLIQAPLSIGGHFQFKHEKSWDVNTGPSLYDKYFEINMDNLALAVSTIPFYERNSIEHTLFNETDILSMNNRAIKYKQKYYDDKSYSTPEMEAQDRILNSLREGLTKHEVDKNEKAEDGAKESVPETVEEDRSVNDDDINLDFKNVTKTDFVPSPVHSHKQVEENIEKEKSIEIKESNDKLIDDIDNNLRAKVVENKSPEVTVEKIINEPKEIIHVENEVATNITIPEIIKKSEPPTKVATTSKTEMKPETEMPKDNPAVETKNPVIETPEDLEKWLDDFLDS